MLKIKDNVDLKELEKYGAKARYDENTGEIIEINFYDEKYKMTSWYLKLKFYKTTKTIFHFIKKKKIFVLEYPEPHNFCNKVDLLYDLIKDGLVEKVGE